MDITSLVVGAIIAAVVGAVVKFLLGNKTKDDFRTKQECDACQKKKTHDEDSIRGDIKNLYDKTNCVDRKVAKLVGAFEARGWLIKENN